MTPLLTPTSSDCRLPWHLTGAAILAMLALYLSGCKLIALPIMAFAVAVAFAVRPRLPASRFLAWILRIAAFSGIVLALGLPREPAAMWYVASSFTNLIGCILSAELVLRVWSRQDTARPVQSQGIILVLSAMILAMGTNTWDRLPMRILAPIYGLLLVLSLRSFAAIGQNRAITGSLRPTFIAMRSAALLMALSLGFTVVLVVDRYESEIHNLGSQFFRNRTPQRTSIGLSNAPRLSAVFNPTPSMERILLIEGPPLARHLRAAAFDTYQNGEWIPAISSRSFKSVSTDRLHSPEPGRQLIFTPLSESMDLLPLPLDAAAIEAASPLEHGPTSELRYHQAVELAPYSATVPARLNFQGPLCLAPEPAARSALLNIPSTIDPRVAELARQLAGQGPPMQAVSRIAAHLQSHHAYSLSFTPNGEPLSDFILNNRAAHCQYFASALVMMARAAGIPARYVIGYYASETHGEQALVVRSRDAHAWAECYIDGTGWVTFDATPASARPDVAFPRPPWWRRLWESIQDLPRLIRSALVRWTPTPSALLTLAAVALFTWVLWHLSKFLRRRQPSVQGVHSPAPEFAQLIRRFERMLRRNGVVLSRCRTWEEQLPPGSPPACIQFINVYNHARFGNAAPQAIQQLSELLGDLERQPTRTQQNAREG